MDNPFSELKLPSIGDAPPEDRDAIDVVCSLYVMESEMENLEAICQLPDGQSKLITSAVRLIEIYSRMNNIIQFLK